LPKGQRNIIAFCLFCLISDFVLKNAQVLSSHFIRKLDARENFERQTNLGSWKFSAPKPILLCTTAAQEKGKKTGWKMPKLKIA